MAKQAAFLLLDNREAFYGGAAGGGKSDALLMAALQYVDVPGYHALILRRTYPQLSGADGLIPRAHEWLGKSDAKWHEQRRMWTFPTGATVEFGHLEYEVTKHNYDGSAYQFIGFDELTSFTETQYEYVGFSRARRRTELAEAGIPIRTRSTGTPGGEGHTWVKRRMIDARKDGVVFIPARVDENPGLDYEDYAESLGHLPDALRRQLLDGDWGAFEGAAFPEFDDETHVLDFEVEWPEAFERYECMDYGLTSPTAWHVVAMDFDGNHIFFDTHYGPGLPSETAAVIRRKRQEWGSVECIGDPNSLAMPTSTYRKGWGTPATIQTEFMDAGIFIRAGNDNPRAGYTRLRELLAPDLGRRFPDWHPRRGDPGCPRIFIARTSTDLIEQLRIAPLQPLTKRWAGEMVDPVWESSHGHAIAAARYGVMDRASPSEMPYEELADPRAELLRKVERAREVAAGRGGMFEKV